MIKHKRDCGIFVWEIVVVGEHIEQTVFFPFLVVSWVSVKFVGLSIFESMLLDCC